MNPAHLFPEPVHALDTPTGELRRRVDEAIRAGRPNWPVIAWTTVISLSAVTFVICLVAAMIHGAGGAAPYSQDALATHLRTGYIFSAISGLVSSVGFVVWRRLVGDRADRARQEREYAKIRQEETHARGELLTLLLGQVRENQGLLESIEQSVAKAMRAHRVWAEGLVTSTKAANDTRFDELARAVKALDGQLGQRLQDAFAAGAVDRARVASTIERVLAEATSKLDPAPVVERLEVLDGEVAELRELVGAVVARGNGSPPKAIGGDDPDVTAEFRAYLMGREHGRGDEGPGPSPVA